MSGKTLMGFTSSSKEELSIQTSPRNAKPSKNKHGARTSRAKNEIDSSPISIRSKESMSKVSITIQTEKHAGSKKKL
jgi:hypothetical protein